MRKHILLGLTAVLLLLVTSCSSAPSLTVPESITVVPVDTAIKVADSQQYMAVAIFADGRTANVTSDVIWSNIESDVANIDLLGLVRAKAIGTTTVTAQLGEVSGSATLTVTATTPIYPITTITEDHYTQRICSDCNDGNYEAIQWPVSHSDYTTPMCYA
jgi:hypothetical protein